MYGSWTAVDLCELATQLLNEPIFCSFTLFTVGLLFAVLRASDSVCSSASNGIHRRLRRENVAVLSTPQCFATPPTPRQIPPLQHQPLVVGEFVLSQELQDYLQRVKSPTPCDVVGGLSDLLNKSILTTVLGELRLFGVRLRRSLIFQCRNVYRYYILTPDDFRPHHTW